MPKTPPAMLYHGTVERFLADIQAMGLTKQKRHHVHLSPDRETATTVGARRGQPVILEIAAHEMHGDGHAFFLSENGVWLTEQVLSRYIAFPAS